MKKLIPVTILSLLISNFLFAQNEQLKKIELANGLASIEIPSTLDTAKEVKMDTSLKTKAYILVNKKNPTITLMYELPEGEAYTKITDNEVTEWADKQLEALKKQEGFRYLDDGVYLQNWKNISYIKWIWKSKKSRDTFNMLFFTNINDKLIQFTFSCPAKLRKKWEPIADAIANSLRVKESTSVNAD